MTNFEMVERLRAKANVSYEEAKAALEAANWDLLDAMVLLEQQGKVAADESASYTTREEAAHSATKGEGFGLFMKKVGEKVVAGINYLTRNSFEISRKGKVVLTVPALVLLLLLLPWLWFTLVLLITGLFFGFKYAFRGPDLGKKPINDAMDKASNVAENIKAEVKNRSDEQSDEQSED